MHIDRKILLLIIFPLIGYAIWAMFRLSVGVFIPEIMMEYNLVEAEGGAIVSLLLGTMAVFMILGGFLSDKVGTKTAMSIGFTILSCGLIFGGYSYNYSTLLLALLITGTGAGIFTPPLYAFVGNLIPASRGTIVGITNGFYGLGGFIGPWLSAILILAFSWRSPFRLIGAISLVLSLILWLSRQKEADQKKILKKSTISPFHFFKGSRIILLCIGIAIASLAFSSFATWAPSYMVKIGGLDLSNAGFSFGLFSIIGAIGAIFFGILSDKIGRRNSILASGLPGFILSLLYFSGYIQEIGLIILSGMIGFTAFAYWNLIISAAQDGVSNELIGSVTGTIQGVAYISSAVAPTISGFMISKYGFSIALILSVALPQFIYAVIVSKAAT